MRWLTEMGVFAKVVEADGFGKAALQLGLTRSAVSKHVSRLEAGLGVKLLHRTTRAMSLTEAGQAVYAQCAVLIQAAAAAEAAAARLAEAPRGQWSFHCQASQRRRRRSCAQPSGPGALLAQGGVAARSFGMTKPRSPRLALRQNHPRRAHGESPTGC